MEIDVDQNPSTPGLGRFARVNGEEGQGPDFRMIGYRTVAPDILGRRSIQRGIGQPDRQACQQRQDAIPKIGVDHDADQVLIHGELPYGTNSCWETTAMKRITVPAGAGGL